jgi:hypothetical protein
MTPKRKMNTRLAYKTPNIRYKTGNRYESITEKKYSIGDPPWHNDLWQVVVTINLTWFNRLGWHYRVSVQQCWAHRREVYYRRYAAPQSPCWYKGREVAVCSFAAEDAARALCDLHGVKLATFNPYVYPETY